MRILLVVLLAVAAVASVVPAAGAYTIMQDPPPPGWWNDVFASGPVIYPDDPDYRYRRDCVVRPNEYGRGEMKHCVVQLARGYAYCIATAAPHDPNGGPASFNYGCDLRTLAPSRNTGFDARREHRPRCQASWVRNEAWGAAGEQESDSRGWYLVGGGGPYPDCLREFRGEVPVRDGGDVSRPPASATGGHDLVSVCGTARFDWYQSSISDAGVAKGEDVCLHMVSNRVAQQLAAEGLSDTANAFGRRLMEFGQGQFEQDPSDYLGAALPSWSRTLRAIGRGTVLPGVGEAVGVALAWHFTQKLRTNLERKDACLAFVTRRSTNLTIDGGDRGSSFSVDRWEFVFNREYVKQPTRNRDMYTATVTQKYPRRLRRDRWKTRLGSMQCGKGGKVFLTKKHDEKKIVSNRVRAVG